MLNPKKLLGSILLCELVGIAGSVFTSTSIATWYPALAKPSFTPPNWLFAPVWTTLFFLMGISLYLILQSKPKPANRKFKKWAIWAFGMQLALSFLWSAIFFGAHMVFLAFAEIMFLWIAIMATILFSRKVSGHAAGLLVPYLLWVTLASTLNFAIWLLN